MQPTQHVGLDLPKDIVANMEKAVASGQYHTPSEIATIALLEWNRRREAAIAELRYLWDEGIASGPGQEKSIDEIIAQARRKSQRPRPQS